jgi:hypothetical protein
MAERICQKCGQNVADTTDGLCPDCQADTGFSRRTPSADDAYSQRRPRNASDDDSDDDWEPVDLRLPSARRTPRNKWLDPLLALTIVVVGGMAYILLIFLLRNA